jgi:hypothetical protein
MLGGILPSTDPLNVDHALRRENCGKTCSVWFNIVVFCCNSVLDGLVVFVDACIGILGFAYVVGLAGVVDRFYPIVRE